MFGYVKPYNDELKLKEIKRYKRYYCALCNELRHSYGRITTAFLSYEMTFTLILLESLEKEENLDEIPLSCQFEKIHIGTFYISKSILQYIAYINIHLVIWKLEDDWKDDKNIFAYLLKKIILNKKTYQRELNKYGRISEVIDENMKKFYEYEKEKYDFDSLSEIMGEIWLQIIRNGAEILNIYDNKLYMLENICKDMGKWLYCIDAYEDLEKDIKKRKFNPLFKAECDINEIKDDAKLILQLILRSMSNNLDKLELGRNKDIIQNIILYGLSHKISEINKKRKK